MLTAIVNTAWVLTNAFLFGGANIVKLELRSSPDPMNLGVAAHAIGRVRLWHLVYSAASSAGLDPQSRVDIVADRFILDILPHLTFQEAEVDIVSPNDALDRRI
jgi:hypothetical protein